MRFPRVRLSVEWVDIPLRFSTRHLMILVAIVGLALGLSVIGRRRGQYLRLANYHTKSAQEAVSLQDHLIAAADRADEGARTTPWVTAQIIRADSTVYSQSLTETAEKLRERASYWSRVASHHDGLRQKYTEAASKPWESIPSDPSAPPDPLQP